MNNKKGIPKICYLVGAGDFAAKAFERRLPRKADFVVAADGGYDSLKTVSSKKSEVDLLVGDFDSLASIPTGGGIIRYPAKKDQTDMFLAMEEGLARGYRIFFIYGATGGRLDHTIGNFQLLSHLANRGGVGFLIGEAENVTIIKDCALHFTSEARGMVSVFSHGGPAKGVSLTGLKYTLDDALLKPDFPLGVSNEFIGFSSEIFVEKGELLIVWKGSVHRTVDLKEIVL
ncbi:MAG: thiamine diphosphokinase [Clostridia bacterium]|nr:thiamine diphosphokinase [Clostridia bacterium]